MRNSNFTKLISTLLLAAMLIVTAASCSERPVEASTNETTAAAAATEGEETEYVDTRFLGCDFDGREFRIQTSTDTTDATNANEMISGSGELNGDVVNDSVYYRNLGVEELLNIELVFTESKFTYDTAEAGVRKLVMAADDAFDLIVNDVRSMVALTDENMFCNIYNADNFDYDMKYWYIGGMEDLTLIPDKMYLMAGDYFMDVIMSCHALFYNKQLCDNFYGDPNYIYGIVSDGKWTYDNMTKIVKETYLDLNGDGKANEGDQFGMSAHGTWGSLIPFIGSSGIQFIDRSAGVPEFCFNNERSVDYISALNELYWSEGSLTTITDSADFNLGLRNLFGQQLTLIVCYQRLNDLSKMRDFEFDIGVIPYPKLYETDDYTTSTHDTTEMGVIPITCTDFDYVTTVIEVLNRETSKGLMTEYYEVALKVKYTTDQISAEMIDLVHDNFGSFFPLAYDMSLNEIMLHSFADPVASKSTDFASTYDKKIKAAQTKLDAMIDGVLSND